MKKENLVRNVFFIVAIFLSTIYYVKVICGSTLLAFATLIFYYTSITIGVIAVFLFFLEFNYRKNNKRDMDELKKIKDAFFEKDSLKTIVSRIISTLETEITFKNREDLDDTRNVKQEYNNKLILLLEIMEEIEGILMLVSEKDDYVVSFHNILNLYEVEIKTLDKIVLNQKLVSKFMFDNEGIKLFIKKFQTLNNDLKKLQTLSTEMKYKELIQALNN